MPTFPTLGSSGLGQADIQIQQYLDLLLKWNAHTNLTAVRQPDDIIRRHLSECIFAARNITGNIKTLLDFGSGAGFPGVPIAIFRPDIAVTLSESQGKKSSFLREVVRILNLRTEVWSGRVEAMPPERVFDAVTLRAVDKMPEACRRAVTRLSPHGSIMIFATRKTEPLFADLPEIRWNVPIPIPRSAQAILMTGIRSS